LKPEALQEFFRKNRYSAISSSGRSKFLPAFSAYRS
jgi:hypothetical protein